jgi:diazepam-binding inhibitor (GABA receptor modulating acyl-CoA-binding protein)
MSVKQQFEEVAKKLAENPEAATNLPNEKQLEIYSLFKQGSIGDVNINRPGMLDLKGKAKWDAWNTKKGMSQEEAQQAYIDLVSALL